VRFVQSTQRPARFFARAEDRSNGFFRFVLLTLVILVL
jgi:hypothetical protein